MVEIFFYETAFAKGGVEQVLMMETWCKTEVVAPHTREGGDFSSL